VTEPRRIGILAPMPSELRPIVNVLSLTRSGPDDPFSEGRAGDTEIVATKTGMGTAAAARATERLLDAKKVDHVLVVGIAGGVDERVAIGDVIVPESVLDGATGTRYEPSSFGDATPNGTLHTSDRMVLDPGELARLKEQGVIALDMETSAVARVCQERGQSWSVIRSISDRVTDGLVDQAVFEMANADGSPNYKAVAKYFLRHPTALPKMKRVARDANTATSAAANAAAAACRRW
jgi:adenosylhomocysteine nucleosidase